MTNDKKRHGLRIALQWIPSAKNRARKLIDARHLMGRATRKTERKQQ